jgi:hypothetical protein
VSGNYRVAPIFLIRMAGAPFDIVARLAVPESISLARDLIPREKTLKRAIDDVEDFFRSRQQLLTKEAYHALRVAVRTQQPPVGISGDQPPFFLNYALIAGEVSALKKKLDHSLVCETDRTRRSLLESSRTYLPRYLLFAAKNVRCLLLDKLNAVSGRAANPGSRNNVARKLEQSLLMYLQRVATKNDTFSEFGPAAWGTIDGEPRSLKLAPQPGIAKRETFLERWTAHGVAAALNADPMVHLELSPRLHPNGRFDGNHFVFVDTGETTELDRKTIEILRRCDGTTPAYLFEEDIPALEQFAALDMIRWEVEVPALDPHAFDVLVSDISRWRDNPVRARWLELLQPIAALPSSFAQATETSARGRIMDEARRQLQNLGATREGSNRFLYSAANPIGEECFRECHFSIGEDLINEVVTEAEPWIDLWRDNYAFVASRVAAGLRALFEKAPPQNQALPLPAFLRHCEMLKMPLTGPAMVGLAHMAFQEVKAAFRERMRDRPDTEEWELTADDCHFVRQNFQYDRFDEFTYPSADLQIEARSVEAVGRGEYRWILAELHPPVALLHHGFYWSCPDKAALGSALALTTKGCPSFHFGFFAADFTAATAVRMLDAIPEGMSFVAPERADPRWRIIPPADIEVYVEDKNGDVCLRTRKAREYLGSFARAWLIPLGFHPFHFGRAPHMPRLRCGRVIVQRRSWTLTFEELGGGNFTGISRDLVLAIERLRAEKGWPRYVYIRPSEQALRRSGAEGRDKDTKPVFIDLESYLFLEIFHRWLTKAGELEISEMLPDPEHLFWQESDGRRSFELRTQIVPR